MDSAMNSTDFLGFEASVQSSTVVEHNLNPETRVQTENVPNLQNRMDNLEKEVRKFLSSGQNNNRSEINGEIKKMELEIQLLESKLKVMQMEQIQQKSAIQPEQKPSNDMTKFFARQTIGGELPHFSGNPEDWPMFYSRYESSTKSCGFNNDENMARLQKCLKGEALEFVKSLLISPQNTEEVINVLRRRYGRPEYVIKALIKKCKSFPPIKEDKPISVINFATSVKNLLVSLESLGRVEYLKNPQLIEDLESKLSPMMSMLWADEIDKNDEYDLRKFCNWLEKKADGLSLRVMPETSCTETKKVRNKVYSTTEVSSKEATVSKKCRVCGKLCRSVAECDSFKKMTIDERWSVATEKRLCFSCLYFGHGTQFCRQRKKCSFCLKSHHALLHKSVDKPVDKSLEQCHSVANDGTTKLRILPVVIMANSKSINTFALLDPGSTTTLVSKDLVESLRIVGARKPLSIQWANGESSTEDESMIVSFRICGTFNNAKVYSINNARTVGNLPLPIQSICKEHLVAKYPYLEKIEFEGYEKAQPKLLIGEDNALLIATRQLIHDSWNSPILSKTWLGWVVSGNDKSDSQKKSNNVLFVYEENDISLHNLVKLSFQMDNVEQQSDRSRSREDDQAEKIMIETATKVNNRWEIGLLWRDKNVILPESKQNAFHRFRLLEQKLNKNPDLKQVYTDIIDDYLKKGYLHRVDCFGPEPDRRWYLPHFPVQNLLKPGKVRIVFDAAAKANGVSLNDNLLQGPDLLKPLISVLFKFRQGQFGFVADIKEMFHRVLIKKEDRSCQRILWRSDLDRPIEVYELTVMMFGATCSPSCAIFCKDLNAQEFKNVYPDAVRAIRESHYMDDYLGSADDIETATKIINDVIKIHHSGGFEIRGWRSSSKDILENIPKELRSASSDEVKVQADKSEHCSRVLGIIWKPSEDIFTFDANFKKIDQLILNATKRPTKRDVLRIVMSVYDPLGFVTHFLIVGRILLQQIWKSGIGWDDEIIDSQFDLWKQWLKNLKSIVDVKIQRCYLPDLPVISLQLHIFSDASEEAYAAVAFVRMQTDSEVFVKFIAARSRVAPLKPQTIPRLELQAATLGCKLMKQIVSGHDINFESIKFWVDSMTVLHWIRSEAKRYKQFVAQRLGLISELTNVNDWNWLPSAMNVADDATRANRNISFDNSSRWYSGPEFLYLPEADWPRQDNVSVDDDECIQFTTVSVEMNKLILPNVERFSNWNRLVRSVGWIIRYVNNLKPANRIKGMLTVDEIEKAEMLCIRRSQEQFFQSEIFDLSSGKQIGRSSKLYKLTPKLENNVIKISGRIDNLVADDSVKSPVILDGKDYYVFLLVKYYHEKMNHVGHETVKNELRQRYWILGLSRLLKAVRHRCYKCKLLFAKPQVPMMGRLPIERLTPRQPAFTFTGVDYFGPIVVKFARRREKRYGVLFTCLNTRAIHVEVAHSLTTDSCIMALRRFIARRGCPKVIYSDNGTNLKGAEHELKESLKEVDQDEIHKKMTTHRIDWKFIPPGAPHMGGAWERLVRSVKTAMYVTLKEAVATDEVLSTVLAEIEQMVNSRPLIDVSVDESEPEALTPNHFLLQRSSASAPIGNFDDRDLILRKQWRLSQRLSDLYWQRWIKEYAPTLIKRTKWYKGRSHLQIGDVVIVVDPNEHHP